MIPLGSSRRTKILSAFLEETSDLKNEFMTKVNTKYQLINKYRQITNIGYTICS